MAISRYGFGNPTLDALLKGTRQVESSNNYGALGPVTKNGDRAYGAYQVMGNNIPNWTQAALGVRMTPEQFLANTEAQDLVARTQFANNLSKYGNAQDAVSTWFTGRPVSKAGNASDGYNTNDEYIRKVIAAAGPEARSMMATATPQGATGAPMGLPGATLAGGETGAPQGAQSISLGDQEQQPLNNIGSTLANMGAAIASLDNRGTGIASLNASRVASNLQAQEAAREKEGGWKYAGQTQNGQGLIFQNAKGEMRVEPLSGQFAGQKESSTTQMLRDMQAHPELLKTYQDLHNTGQQSNYDEDGNWKYETSKEDVATLIKRAAAGEGNDVLKGQTKKTRADFNHLVTEMGVAPETFAAGKANQSGLLQQSREFGRRQGVLEIAVPKLQADITVARDLLQQYKKENPNGSWKGWNWLKNAGTEEFTGPGAQTLAKLKETFKTLTDQFGTVQQNGQLTEASRQQAAKLINENMDTGVAEAVLDNMQSLGVRSLNSVRQAHENHMARIMKQPIPYPELEVDPEANGGSKKSTIRNTEPSSGIDKNAAMEELRRRGLIK